MKNQDLIIAPISKERLPNRNVVHRQLVLRGILISGGEKTMARIIDLIGRRFTRLTVKKELLGKKWYCQCDCGGEKIASTGHLTSGGVQSCGCLRKENTARLGKSLRKDKEHNPNYRHGQSNSTAYKTWQAIKERCNTKNNPSYKDYGGRGIKVCKRWLGEDGFKNFLDDMGERPKNMEIDRVDNEGNYELSNCRWTTRVINARNTRAVRLDLEKVNEIKKLYSTSRVTQKELAGMFNVCQSTISAILNNKIWQ